jgi:hypothetical protein
MISRVNGPTRFRPYPPPVGLARGSLKTFVDCRIEDADEGKVAVALGIVKAIPDSELVKDVEADVREIDCGARLA